MNKANAQIKVFMDRIENKLKLVTKICKILMDKLIIPYFTCLGILSFFVFLSVLTQLCEKDVSSVKMTANTMHQGWVLWQTMTWLMLLAPLIAVLFYYLVNEIEKIVKKIWKASKLL